MDFYNIFLELYIKIWYRVLIIIDDGGFGIKFLIEIRTKTYNSFHMISII